MNPEYEKLEREIDDINAEIQRLNDLCALKLNELTQDSDSRIMSYGQTQEINETVDKYTVKIAKLIVELEELEEVKRIFLEETGKN